jgi:hypothetical protein
LTLTELRTYVRDLTGVYATDLISDTILTRWVNEAYYELHRSEAWSWTPTTLSSGSDTPSFDSQFHQILAYRVAAKVLGTQADDTQRYELYVREYDLLLTSMREYYFPRNAVGATVTFSSMIQAVRDLSGVNSNAINTNLIKQWINEAYTVLCNRRDWEWLEATQTFVNVDDTGPYLLTDGCRRVLSCRLLDANGDIEEVFDRPDTNNVRSNRNFAYYDVDVDGNILLSPAERFDGSETYIMTVRYTKATPILVNNSDMVDVNQQFASIVTYSAAVQALMFVGQADNPRVKAYSDIVAALYEALVSQYELSHDTTSFQLGAEGREIQQYPYWLRRY